MKYRIEQANGRVVARGTQRHGAYTSISHLSRLVKKRGGWLEVVSDGGPDDGAPWESEGTYEPRFFTRKFTMLCGKKKVKCNPGDEFWVLQKCRDRWFVSVLKGGAGVTEYRCDGPASALRGCSRKLTKAEIESNY